MQFYSGPLRHFLSGVDSLVVSAGLTALGSYLSDLFPGGRLLMSLLNSTISLVLISALFAAIYKILPDKPIAWRDVAVGSVITAILFTIGKSLIGLYIGSSGVASSYGAAGALLILLYGSTTPPRFSCLVPNTRAPTPKRTGATPLIGK